MRLEERSNGNYIKVPDPIEQQLIKIVNRFFINDPEALKNSREGIIIELQNRVTPMVRNMVKRIAWLEGKAIFEEELKSVIEEEMAGVLQEVMDYVENLKLNVVKEVNYDWDITTNSTGVLIPGTAVLDPTKDIIQVYVNGMLQKKGKHYNLTTNAVGKVDGVSFLGTLENQDTVALRCLSFTT